LRAQALAPTEEIRLIMSHKMSKSSDSFLGRIRIENDLNEPEKRVILNGDDGTWSGHQMTLTAETHGG
jgi:hypothetical protein